ncbi:unnamed protein product [Prunus armeniaca]|uniref:Uncharacterized protein n=1 Tax=Prunus armeniaca TaxID=36596 RepID=A0A6J5UBH4_PRUAR|nr:unnamed protein product [Prunus armeniaca]
MATLRSNRIKKQLFEDDMGDVMKTDVVALQVGPFNFRPFPFLVIQQSNVDEEAEVNNYFVGSLLHPDVYDLPPIGPNILSSSSNNHGIVDGNYEGYKTPICSPESLKIISNYNPGYSYQYGSIEMCNDMA